MYELQVQRDLFGPRVAAAPARFHVADRPFGRGEPGFLAPDGQIMLDLGFEPFAHPLVQDRFALLLRNGLLQRQRDMIVVERDAGILPVFDDQQGIEKSEKPDGIAGFIVFRRVGGTLLNLFDVLSDPVRLFCEQIPDRALRKEPRRDHAHFAVRRQDRHAQIFDLFPHKDRVDPGDRDVLFRVHLTPPASRRRSPASIDT